jgi:hypothetical protein
MKKFILVFLFSTFLVSCGTPSSVPEAEVGTSCESLQPAVGDIQYALNFGRVLFTNEVWQRSYTVQELEVTVVWNHRGVLALSQISVELLCDGNGTTNMELYYNNETIQADFINYDSAAITSSCANGDLTLYELDALEEGVNYKIRKWVQPLNETRVSTVELVFSKEDNALLEKYSQEFFPSLPKCK